MAWKTPSFAPALRAAAMEHILAEVSAGRPVDRILREDAHMPSKSQFWRWHMEDAALRDNLARARECGADCHMDEAIAIADEQEHGERVETDGNGAVTKRVKEDMIAHRRLRIDTRIRAAQMMAPRKYGPKVDVTTGGEKLPAALDMATVPSDVLRALAKAQEASDEGG